MTFILLNMNAKTLELERALDTFNLLSSQYKLPRKLHLRGQGFLLFLMHIDNAKNSARDDRILDSLPHSLREAVGFARFQEIIKMQPLFRDAPHVLGRIVA